MKFLRKLAMSFGFMALALGLSGCGERVEVPPASVGMVLGSNGFQGEIIPPSRFRLAGCYIFMVCDKLVVIEAGDVAINETFEIRMPKEQINFGISTKMTLSLSANDDALARVFARIPPTRLESGNYGTTIATVYDTYGAAIVTNAVRATVSGMSMHDVMNNQAATSEKIRLAIVESFKRTPLELREFTMTDLRLPGSVTAANEAVARKVSEIAQAEASAQVQIRKAQADLEVTRARRTADILAAETTAQMNTILANGVTPAVLRYMELQVLQEVAKNGNTIFFPMDMVGSGSVANRVMLQDVVPTK